MTHEIQRHEVAGRGWCGAWDIPSSLRNKPTRSENVVIEIHLKRNEPVEKGLRRLKKQMLREGVIKELKQRRYYEKPSVCRRRKRKAAVFEAMLKQRHAED